MEEQIEKYMEDEMEFGMKERFGGILLFSQSWGYLQGGLAGVV